MLEKIKKWCERYQMLEPGDTVLIACSGGPDSMVLADALLSLRQIWGLTLAVGHVNHMFRGTESDGDAAFVASFCAECGLPYYEKRIDVPAYCGAHGLSREEGARAVRYAFLRDVAGKLGGAKIATGHHRDDQAETVLLHLLRGAGSSGIGGIKAENGEIIRPLLALSREEIEQYCNEKALRARLDSSNIAIDYTRNRIRLELLPTLAARYNPAVKDALCRTAELIGEEHAFVRGSAAALWQDVIREKNDCLLIDCTALRALHLALKRELVRMVIERFAGSLRGIGFDHVEAVLCLCDSGRVGALLQLPGNLILRRTYETVELFFRRSFDRAARIDTGEIPLQLPGRTRLPQYGVSIEAKLIEVNVKVKDVRTAVFDLDRLVLPLYVRQRREGDRFQPDGMCGTKKLKDFFIDAKVERSRRDEIPLICDQAGILWIGGYRRCQRGSVIETSKNLLQLTMIADEIGEAEGKYDE